MANKVHTMRCRLAAGLAVACAVAGPAFGQSYGPPKQDLLVPVDVPEVGVEQKLGAQVPLDAQLIAESGEPMTLGSAFDGRPVVLSLMYYECPMLCTQILNGMLDSFKTIEPSVGTDFQVFAISIDPDEGPALAREKKATAVEAYGRPGAAESWHFLTGPETEVRRIADAVGFGYQYDPTSDQYAHGSAIMVLTPEGKVSQYLFGIEYPPVEMAAAIGRAGQSQFGSKAQEIIMRCFMVYDVARGQYTISVLKTLKFVGAGTVACVVGLVALLVLLERRKRRKDRAHETVHA